MALSRKLLFVAIASVPFGFACNGIIGLSDFQYGECPGARCGDAGFGDPETSVIDHVVPDTGPPFEAGPGAQPVSWANWLMPTYPGANGGVQPIYDAGTSGDAGIVTDAITKLVWQQTPIRSLSYEAAVKACKDLEGVGSGKWRLPKRIELVTLLDYSKSTQPYVNGVFVFANDTLWTSSEWRINIADQDQSVVTANDYWVVDFEHGLVKHSSTSSNVYGALCVKAN